MSEELATAFYEGQTVAYCSLVRTGKPVASLQIPTALLDVVESICTEQGCRVYTEDCCDEPAWSMVYIYEQPIMLDIIKASKQLGDLSTVNIWFKGCMYGYTLSAIEQMARRLVPTSQQN